MTLDKKITLIFDYDLTLTEDWQQVPYLKENFKAIRKEYDGKKVKHPKTGEEITLSIKEPGDYFQLSDLWATPHNGVGYVMQMIYDAKKGIIKNFNEKTLKNAGSKVQLSPGLPRFFKELRKEWNGKCELNYFIVSVGLVSLIEGSSIVKSGEIREVFATPLFDIENFWQGKKQDSFNAMADVVSPFNKTAYAIEIAKGGRKNLDKLLKHRDYSCDYRNILCFGDGSSDISQFAYLRRKGAWIAGVYKHDSVEAYDRIRTNKLIQDRAHAILPRDYRKDSDLWTYTNQTIDARLKRRCGFDPELVDMYRKKKIRNLEAKSLVKNHIAKCSYCSNLMDIKFVQPDNKED